MLANHIQQAHHSFSPLSQYCKTDSCFVAIYEIFWGKNFVFFLLSFVPFLLSFYLFFYFFAAVEFLFIFFLVDMMCDMTWWFRRTTPTTGSSSSIYKSCRTIYHVIFTFTSYVLKRVVLPLTISYLPPPPRLTDWLPPPTELCSILLSKTQPMINSPNICL